MKATWMLVTIWAVLGGEAAAQELTVGRPRFVVAVHDYASVSRTVLAALWPAGVSAAAEPGPRVGITVLNYAGVPRAMLDIAKSQASSIFSKAGVTIEWWEPVEPESANQDLPPIVPAFFVKLLPDSMSPPVRPSPDAFGSALGIQAFLLVGRIQQATEEGLVCFPKILGHIMAHELGHILLGEENHALGSIMSASLGQWEFRQMERGVLLFTPAQANRMRERLLAQKAPEPTVVLPQK